MANADRPRGAAPIRHLNGSTNFVVNSYPVDSSNSVAVFLGDFMIMESDGNVIAYASGGGDLIGVVAGVADGYDNLTQKHLAASTSGNVWIYDDPDIIFVAQEDDVDGTALAATNVGNNCDVLVAAGSTTTGRSAHEIDRSTAAATVAQLKLLRLSPRPDNAYGASADWEFLINEHQLRPVDLSGV